MFVLSLKKAMVRPVFLAAALAVGAALPAYAHNALITADKPNVEVGEGVDVATTISEPFGTPDMPFYVQEEYEYLYGPIKVVAIDGGKVTELVQTHHGFKDGSKKKLSTEEINTGLAKARSENPDAKPYSLLPKVFNSNIAEYTVQSGGTVSFVGLSTYGKPAQVRNFMKTFVNLTADGESTKARAAEFGFKGIELRPVEDLANLTPGGTVKVEALLNGKPQSGVIIYCGMKDLPESERICGIENFKDKKNPIYSAAISDRNGIVTLPLPNRDGETYLFTDGHLSIAPDKARYRSTISFHMGGK